MAIWTLLFGNKHSSALVGMILFQRRIADLARAYRWQDCVLLLALDKHQLVIDRGDLSVVPEDWNIDPSLAGSYLRPDLLIPSKPYAPSATTPTTTAPSSSRPTRSAAAPNDTSVVCERYNAPGGCNWKQCKRKHVCANCGGNHTSAHYKTKEK